MKIGLIADVHGDLSGLEAALDLLEAQGCAEILCAGDLVDKGLESDDVVRLIDRRGIPCVAGNHDLDAEYVQNWLHEHGHHDHPLILEAETVVWLKGLPLKLVFEDWDVPILLSHGTPTNPFFYLYWNEPDRIYHAEMENVTEKVIVVGHTHVPMQVRYRDHWILNPGAVCGQDFGHGSHTCAVLTLPTCDFDVFDIVTGQPAPFKRREIDRGSV